MGARFAGGGPLGWGRAIMDTVVSPRAQRRGVGTRLVAAPKTKGSRRRVSLTRGAVDALSAHLARQLEEIDRAGSLWQENGLVFTSELGEPSTGATSLRAGSSRFSSARNSQRRPASMTCGTRAQHFS
jgi:GNAT superfamily N-acetyltransferase